MMKPPSLTSENPSEFPPSRPRKPRNKKSRESPNFSDCNCCNRRIYNINPKNRVEILKSEWRIILLCKICYNLVEKSEICSYCLIRVSSEFYDCIKCRRRIHKDCAEKFSYDFSGNSCDDFSVCFDCWIPNLLEDEFNRSRVRKKQLGKNRVDQKSVTSSGLHVLLEKDNCLEDVVNEAEKKIVVAVEAKEKAFRKIMMAKKAVECASGAVGIFTIDEGGDDDDDEDGELTIRLQREMNQSSRVSGNECLLNSRWVDVPRVNEASFSCLGTKVAMVANGMGIDEPSGVRRECRSCRKGRGSKVVKCKEKMDCALKLYSRKPSQVGELMNLEAGRCFQRYSRRHLHCKRISENNSLNLENGNRFTDMPLNCREERMLLTNAT